MLPMGNRNSSNRFDMWLQYLVRLYCNLIETKVEGDKLQPNKKYILELINRNNWSQNKFAKKAGVSNATISRWINGKRGAGSELIAGIIKAFPNEPINKLFFL